MKLNTEQSIAEWFGACEVEPTQSTEAKKFTINTISI